MDQPPPVCPAHSYAFKMVALSGVVVDLFYSVCLPRTPLRYQLPSLDASVRTGQNNANCCVISPSNPLADLSQRIDLPALQAYHETVRIRTVEVTPALLPAQVDEVNDPAYLRQVLVDEGVFSLSLKLGDPLPFQSWTKGVLLAHFAMTHNYGHFCEAAIICSLLGINFGG